MSTFAEKVCCQVEEMANFCLKNFQTKIFFAQNKVSWFSDEPLRTVDICSVIKNLKHQYYFPILYLQDAAQQLKKRSVLFLLPNFNKKSWA